MKALACLMLLTALTLSAADVTGKWSGSFDMSGPGGETKASTALLNLKQSGTEITGTLGPDENEQLTIQKGKIEGDKLSLDVSSPGESGAVIHFDLVVAGDRITGDAKLSHDGETRTAKLDVTRASRRAGVPRRMPHRCASMR